MKTATSNRFARMLKTAVVVTGLAFTALPAVAAQPCYFGECASSASTPVVAKADDFKVIIKQGNWTVLRNSQTTVVDRQFDDGAMFVFIKNKDSYGLGFIDQSWNLKEGQTFNISTEIDGKTFTGKATATAKNTVVVSNVSDEFLQQFANGDLAKFEVAGSRWTIVPHDVATLIKAAANT